MGIAISAVGEGLRKAARYLGRIALRSLCLPLSPQAISTLSAQAHNTSYTCHPALGTSAIVSAKWDEALVKER